MTICRLTMMLLTRRRVTISRLSMFPPINAIRPRLRTLAIPRALPVALRLHLRCASTRSLLHRPPARLRPQLRPHLQLRLRLRLRPHLQLRLRLRHRPPARPQRPRPHLQRPRPQLPQLCLWCLLPTRR